MPDFAFLQLQVENLSCEDFENFKSDLYRQATGIGTVSFDCKWYRGAFINWRKAMDQMCYVTAGYYHCTSKARF